MGSFLAAFVRNNECFTALKLEDTVGIHNVVKQWQHARKTFDSHPISRKKDLGVLSFNVFNKDQCINRN